MRVVKWFAPLLLVLALGAAAVGIAACTRPEAEEPELATVYDTEVVVDRSVGTMTQEDYPAGCEVVALINALHSFGVDLDFGEAYFLFDHSTGDFVNSWWGDPYTEGAAYPPAVTKAANRALDGTPHSARDMTGETTEGIADCITNGGVCIVWYTTDDQPPRWTDWEVDGYRMYSNEHAVVVYDMGGGFMHVMDSLQGLRDIGIGEFTKIWEDCGSMAVALK